MRHRKVHQEGYQIGCFTEKQPLQECCSFTPNTFQHIPFLGTIENNVPLHKGLNKQRMKSLGQRNLNTHGGGFFRKGKCPYQKDLYPYFPSRSLSNLLISILRQSDSHHLESKKSVVYVSVRHLSSCCSSHCCHSASQRITTSTESRSA